MSQTEPKRFKPSQTESKRVKLSQASQMSQTSQTESKQDKPSQKESNMIQTSHVNYRNNMTMRTIERFGKRGKNLKGRCRSASSSRLKIEFEYYQI